MWDSEGISESEDRVVEQLFEACDADSDSESSSGDKKKRKKKTTGKKGKVSKKDGKKKKKSSSASSESAKTVSSESSSSSEAFLPWLVVQTCKWPNPHMSRWVHQLVSLRVYCLTHT